jgi:hypothetical protein
MLTETSLHQDAEAWNDTSWIMQSSEEILYIQLTYIHEIQQTRCSGCLTFEHVSANSQLGGGKDLTSNNLI